MCSFLLLCPYADASEYMITIIDRYTWIFFFFLNPSDYFAYLIHLMYFEEILLISLRVAVFSLSSSFTLLYFLVLSLFFCHHSLFPSKYWGFFGGRALYICKQGDL